jgi:ArsR family transcriptional regulator
MDLETRTNFAGEARNVASLLRALSNEQRLLIVCHLAEEGELSVGQLGDRLDLSQSALSQHLARLRAQGIVSTRKQAQTIFYAVADAKTRQVLALLHDLYCPDLGRDPGRNERHD